MKKKRIRIHKNTLRYLNNPKYVYLLINPEKKVLAIKSSNVKKRDAVKIDYNSEKDCEIYSISLIEQMSSLKDAVNASTTYKLFGRTYTNNGIIEFDIF